MIIIGIVCLLLGLVVGYHWRQREELDLAAEVWDDCAYELAPGYPVPNPYRESAS